MLPGDGIERSGPPASCCPGPCRRNRSAAIGVAVGEMSASDPIAGSSDECSPAVRPPPHQPVCRALHHRRAARLRHAPGRVRRGRSRGMFEPVGLDVGDDVRAADHHGWHHEPVPADEAGARPVQDHATTGPRPGASAHRRVGLRPAVRRRLGHRQHRPRRAPRPPPRRTSRRSRARPAPRRRSTACEGAAGSTVCTFTGEDYTMVVRVRTQAASAAEAHAVTDVEFRRP